MADRWIIPFKVDLENGAPLKPCTPYSLMVPGDNLAHIIEVTVKSGGEPAEVAGNVRGYFIRQGGDGATVVCTGSLSESVARVTMSPQCYAYTGKLRCVVRIENTNGPDFTLIDTIFYVHEGIGDNIVDPGSPIQDVTELLEYLDEMQEATENAEAAVSYIANEYSLFRDYAVGDYAIHSGYLYRCTTAITTPETWTEAHWTQVNLGGEVAKVADDLIAHNAIDALRNIPRKSGSKESSGITFVWNPDNSITVTGTATAATYANIYSSDDSFPDGIVAGQKYHVDYHAENVNFAVYPYIDNAETLGAALVDTLSEADFTIPANATGIIFRYRVRNGVTANETVKVALLPAASNKLLNRNTDAIRVTLDEISNECNATINLLDPEEITEGYILSNNVPVARENYYYSDYIKIGMLPFCHSQGGSVSEQIHCYDANKNFIGSIAVDKNTSHYEARNSDKDGNLRYVYIKPLDGTVYVRVNGSTSRPKMVTPFFSPLEYGASAQNLPYGEIFKKHGLRIAMFGDSITLGRDGNSSAILDENIPYYVEKITRNHVNNFGVGSMGWVSTAYSAQIAYDKISSVDLTSYDVITLCYGVNDTAAQIGEWNSVDETTICGQINKCIKYIAAQNHKAKIILIAPFNTCGTGEFPGWRYPVVTGQGWSRQMLSDKEKQIAEYYYIDFISQKDSPYNGFGFGMPDGTKTHVFCGQDDVHPTAEGYKALGHWFASKISGCIQ